MLRAVSLVAQWERLRTTLPERWADAQLSLRLVDESRSARAAALLGPFAPGRAGRELSFHVARRGAGSSAAAVGRALGRLDVEGIDGELTLVGADEAAAEEAWTQPRLAESWDRALAELPADWTDLYAQVELASSDHLDPGALALAPLNPARYGPTAGFRFRCARRFGYGASEVMARRCLARLDERRIPGRLSIVRVLSDTKPVATQGPVWYVGGKVV